MSAPTASSPLLDDLSPASTGTGPLLQRDYWAVIASCKVEPQGVMQGVAKRFVEFSPPELVRFAPQQQREDGLQVGDDFDVHIRLAGSCRVRVVRQDDQSFTLATLKGHPESGRITFGAYRNLDQEVLFHIRSRARASNPANYMGFLTAGEPMQTNTWADFVRAVALTFGEGVAGVVHAETKEIEDEGDSSEVWSSPTFVATGG